MRILLVTGRYPWPPRRGDQIRTGQLLDLLAGAGGHTVTLLTPAPAVDLPAPREVPGNVAVVTYRPPGTAAAKAGGLARALLRGLPLQSGLFFAPDLRRQLRRLAPGADLAVLQLSRLALHRGDLGDMPVLVDLIDDLALNFERRAAFDRTWLRPLLTLEARRLAGAQRRLAAGAAGLLVVCDRDRATVMRRLPPEEAARVSTVGLMVEAGRPGDPGMPAEAAPLPPAPYLVFTGNLGYFVNADAITWWLREVWPAVAARQPGISLVIAGDRPGRRVRQAVGAAAGNGRVQLIASPRDLAPWLAGAAVSIAPLRGGSGVPVKVLEAWAAGVPVVASPWAARGTSGQAGEDLLIADTAGDWAAALDMLLGDAARRQTFAAAGRRRLAADYSRQAVGRQLRAALADLAR